MSNSISRSLGGVRNGSPLGGAKSPLGGITNNGVRNLPKVGNVTTKSPLTGRSDIVRSAGKALNSGVVKDLGNAKGKLGNVVGRGLDSSVTKGKLGDIVGRGVGKDLGKDLGKVVGNGKLGEVTKGRIDRGRLSDLVGGKLGSKDSPVGRGGSINDMLKGGRIRTGGLAQIDRSKLRDLVKGIEAGNVKGPIGGKAGNIFGGINKLKLADAFRVEKLKPFHAGDLHGAKFATAKHMTHILPGGCFPTHHDHCHDWFNFCFGGFWFDYHHSYNDHCHDYYYYDNYCWEPVYVYPTCGVTFGAYPEAAAAGPEIVTVASVKPVTFEQPIDLSSPSDALLAAETGEEEPNIEITVDPATALAEALAAAQAANDAAADTTAVDAADENEPTAETKPVITTQQPELDLELIDVEMADAGDRDANFGPRFKVTIRNSGKRSLESFIVSLVACKDSQIDSGSLHASATVERLAAGEETMVEVTLPADSLSLNRDNEGRATPFNTLIAAVDSDERITEGNEENNLSLIDRSSIRLAGN
jgi:hypothetical protein